MEVIVDKAGEKYWTKVWGNSDLQSPIDVESKLLKDYINRRFHKKFKEIFTGGDVQGKTLLEVGCGNSVWLPYFANQFGLKVSGLDYSEYGCEQSRQILKREKVAGEIICGYAGLALMSGAYISIGLYASSITNNQIVAFLLALSIGLFFHIIFEVLAGNFTGFMAQVFITLSLNNHFESISRGVVDTRDLVYFASIIFVGLFLSELSLTKRNMN